MQVFLSHQRSDKNEAEKIAEYLKSCGINVYFDKFDKDLQQAVADNNPKGVVAAIKKGVAASSDMLVLVSANTLRSEWVPFEIGYGYDALEVKALTLKGIKSKDIPDYIKVVPIIRDIYDMEIYSTGKGSRSLMEVRGITRKAAGRTHPLSGVMDDIIT